MNQHPQKITGGKELMFGLHGDDDRAKIVTRICTQPYNMPLNNCCLHKEYF